MFFKRIDYLIFYEHVARELESVKKLKSYLDGLGYKGVIIPIHYNRYLNVLKYRPSLVIVPYLYSENNLTYMRYKKLYSNVRCLNLHSEQIYNANTIDFMMPSDEYSKDVFHISWGKEFSKMLVKYGVSNEKIFITGSIRNDAVKDYKSSNNPNNILIATSFSLTMVSDDYIKNLTQAMDSEKLYRNIEFTKKSRDLFFSMIYKVSKIYSEKNFYLRPHPHVDLDVYRKVFREVNKTDEIPKNIIIERKGSIQEFMTKGEKLLTWHSTSVLEGAMMGKKVSILAPIKFPEHMIMSFMEHINIIESEDELKKFIESTEKGNSNLENYLYDNFYVVDGKSSIRVAKVVEKILSDTKEVKIKDFSQLRILISMSLKKDIGKNILLKLRILDKINKNYKGIIEDSLEIKKIENKNEILDKVIFKNENEGVYVQIT